MHPHPQAAPGTAVGPAPPGASTDVGDVIRQMQSILAPLKRSDGVACFTCLYLEVTRDVQSQLAASRFSDPAFLADLDRRFAKLFFTACTAPPGRCPAAWTPLFKARSRKGVAPIQFALAGMNAHINRDLPVAIVNACEHAAIEPREGSPQHHDYLRVNTLLATVETKIKTQYVTGWLHTLDRLTHPIHRLDDILAMWDISRARDAAWINAQTLWALRTTPPLYQRYLATLDQSVGLASRGLLTPADTWLRRLSRLLRQ